MTPFKLKTEEDFKVVSHSPGGWCRIEGPFGGNQAQSVFDTNARNHIRENIQRLRLLTADEKLVVYELANEESFDLYNLLRPTGPGITMSIANPWASVAPIDAFSKLTVIVRRGDGQLTETRNLTGRQALAELERAADRLGTLNASIHSPDCDEVLIDLTNETAVRLWDFHLQLHRTKTRAAA